MPHSHVPRESDAVAVYRYTRAAPISIGVFVAVLIAVAAFVFYLGTTLPAKTLSQRSMVKVKNIDLGTHSFQDQLHLTSAALVVLAVLMLVLLWVLSRERKGRFELHTAGVVRQIGTERSFTPFGEIQDVYMFAGGKMAFSGLINNLAYRTEPQKAWIAANAGLKKFEEFMAAFRELHVIHRMPLVQHDINVGHRVTFRYINTAQVYWKRLAGGFLRLKTQELSLSNKGLHLGDDTWPYAQLQPIKQSEWTERMAIKNVSGEVVFSCMGTSMLSADVFVALFGEQLGRKEASVF